MPELRKDPVVGRWVIIATERAQRPSDFAAQPVRPVGSECVFCEGNEHKTPPEILAALRAARISGGVLCSLPSQKTHSLPTGRTGCAAKSEGRCARSVAMITQRPTTGSLRSSGIATSVGGGLDGPLRNLP